MTIILDKQASWSAKGMSLAVWATAVAVALALADGVFHGPLSFKNATADFHVAAFLSMLGTRATISARSPAN